MAVLNTRDELNAQLSPETSIMSTGADSIATVQTEATVREILKHGTPDWVKHPEDYKNLAKEDYLRTKENSDKQVSSFKMDGQDILADENVSKINRMSLDVFMSKLRSNGLKAWCVESTLRNNTGGLWVTSPTTEGFKPKFVTTIQYPAMYEYSVLRLDDHGLPIGEKFIGWRNAVAQLIVLGIWSEEQAHRVFGPPVIGPRSVRYRKTLWNYRNNRPTCS